MAATSKPIRQKVKGAELKNKKTTHKYIPNKEVAKATIKKNSKSLKEAVKISGMGKKGFKEKRALEIK